MTAPDRTLRVFETFESAVRPLTLSEFADASGMPISTSHGILQALVRRGYLYLTSSRKDFFPTRRLYDMAAKINAHDPFLELLAPRLRALRDATQETVIVGKRQGETIVYLAVLEGPQLIRYSAKAGDIKPLYSTSIGKALLSTLSAAALRTWVAHTQLAAITEHTLTSREGLQHDIEEARRKGYAVTRGESVGDVYAVATPVSVNHDVLGIAVAGPKHRLEGVIERTAQQLLAVRADIEGGHA